MLSVIIVFRYIFRCHHWLFCWYIIPLDSPVLQENLIERICQRLQCLFSFGGLQLTFPNGDTVPVHSSKFMLNLQIPFFVPLYLVDPELRIGFWYSIIATTLMSMPKATIHKDASAIFAKDYIWRTRQSTTVDTITESAGKEISPHHHLRLRILGMNRSHDLATLFCRQLCHIPQMI